MVLYVHVSYIESVLLHGFVYVFMSTFVCDRMIRLSASYVPQATSVSCDKRKVGRFEK